MCCKYSFLLGQSFPKYYLVRAVFISKIFCASVVRHRLDASICCLTILEIVNRARINIGLKTQKYFFICFFQVQMSKVKQIFVYHLYRISSLKQLKYTHSRAFYLICFIIFVTRRKNTRILYLSPKKRWGQKRTSWR